jgi:hypothetical protein
VGEWGKGEGEVMDFSMFADLTFWQWVALIVVALPITAIVLCAAIFVIGVIFWFTIKMLFIGAVLFVIIAMLAGVVMFLNQSGLLQ